ncbi:protein of unknown function UPF0150 [Hymenobacter roseosalivarius DSM 11622]|uniref:Uncharacterized protein n=1 Tax=Hymenobacter roseosalivarius DSM 11622 TaxID=645990 RepID=A0A1W1VFQ6_9BACT|nr:hypothetical protein [Hymenobacter roseosalivarius]SMB92165.1 protein of unknown function UPF0150 [Hymenobacter roseosalivarius DSM 11622]
MESDVLKLTGIIEPGDLPNTYMGRIKEIIGIVSQGKTSQEAYVNLVATTASMLEYKRDQALALLEKQNNKHVTMEPNAKVKFYLETA